MGQVDTVAGLELRAIPHAKYVKCDRCGATLNGPADGDRITTSAERMREYARSLGWVGPMDNRSGEDLCPGCSSRGP